MRKIDARISINFSADRHLKKVTKANLLTHLCHVKRERKRFSIVCAHSALYPSTIVINQTDYSALIGAFLA